MHTFAVIADKARATDSAVLTSPQMLQQTLGAHLLRASDAVRRLPASGAKSQPACASRSGNLTRTYAGLG